MTEAAPRDCPAAETLAAFIDGSSTTDERTMLSGHLETCEACMSVVREAAAFDREQETVPAREANVVPLRGPTRWWMAAAASVAVAIIGGYAIWQLRPDDSLHQLYAAAAKVDYRPVEGRLHGMEFRPIAPVERSGRGKDESAASLKLRGAAGDVLEASGRTEDPSAMHAAGIARVMTGNPREGVARIEAATAVQQSNARYWSDLAAARLSEGKAEQDPHAFGQALAAADRALRLDPRSPEALFNRALALESMNLSNEAAEAYRQYLKVDGTSSWAAEVRERLSRLEKSSSRSTWKDAIGRLSATDREMTRSIVRSHPEEARRWGEGIFLGQWAEAFIAERTDEAEVKLSIARALGLALREVNGEQLLADSVAVIDRSDAGKRQALARAQLAYQQGRIAYDRRNVTVALKHLSTAAGSFRALGSPMAENAAYYHASALHDSHRSDEALATNRALQRAVPADHLGLHAHLDWQEGSILGSMGRLVESLAAFRASSDAFHRLGETSNAAIMDQSTGFGYSSTGRRLEAWKSYLRAWPAMRSNDDARTGSLMALSRSEIAEEHWDVARSLSDLGLALAPRAPNPRRETHLWLQRAIANRNIDPQAAVQDLGHAKQSAGRITDQSLRESAMFDIRFLEAILSRDRQPDHAVQLLSANIDWARTQQRLIRVPEQYLERSRAELAASRTAQAAADLHQALAMAEGRGSALQDLQARASFMSSLDAAVEENVDALLRDQKVREAFDLAEKSRKRVFSSSVDADTAVRAEHDIPEGVIVAQYLSLPGSTVIFTTDRKGLTAYRQGVTRAGLNRMVDDLRAGIERGNHEEAIRSATQLFDVLLKPFSDRFKPNGTIVVVPDSVLARVPFAALRDRRSGQFLIEQVQVRFAPTSGWVLTSRSGTGQSKQQAVVVGNPSFDRELLAELPALPAAAKEAGDIARIYGVQPLLGSQGTTDTIFGSLREASVFHFAGHAVVNEAEPRNSFLVCAVERGKSGLMYLHDIEQLSLRKLELAMVAGCRTAGAVTSSRHPQSVALAFLRAGAANAVGSLWDLEDRATTQVSTRIHEKFAAGAPISRALRETQIELLRSEDPRMRELKVWAGFQVWGSQDNQIEVRGTKKKTG